MTSVDSQSYIANCLVPSKKFLHKGKILQQDGARCHHSAETSKFFEENGIKTLQDWPPYSPDLNPIETLWAILAKRVSDMGPRSEEKLIQFTKEVWDEIPQRLINRLSLSFRIRLLKVKSKGGDTIKP